MKLERLIIDSLNESTKTHTGNLKVPPKDVVKWVKLTKQWEDSPGRQWGRPYTGTAETGRREGVCTLDSILKYKGARGEVRTWGKATLRTTGEEVETFGFYIKDDWYKFLDDIKKNGMQEPIWISVKKDGQVVISEGNHRREAAKQLGLKTVPVQVRYYGDIQLDPSITDFTNVSE